MHLVGLSDVTPQPGEGAAGSCSGYSSFQSFLGTATDPPLPCSGGNLESAKFDKKIEFEIPPREDLKIPISRTLGLASR